MIKHKGFTIYTDIDENTEERQKTEEGWIWKGHNQFQCHTDEYGWPFKYRELIHFRGGIDNWSFGGFALNSIVSLGIIIIVAAISETIIRSRSVADQHKPAAHKESVHQAKGHTTPPGAG